LFKGGAAILADSQNGDIIVLSVSPLAFFPPGIPKAIMIISGRKGCCEIHMNMHT
jgi:hypothetical protein